MKAFLVTLVFLLASFAFVHGGGLNLQAVADVQLSLSANVDFTTAAWGDYNCDGYPDLALLGSPPTVQLFSNKLGASIDLFASLTGLGDGLVVWADVNADGLLDVLLTGVNAAGTSQVVLAIGNGAGVFVQANVAIGVGLAADAAVWGDLNNDGLLDLVIGGTLANGNADVQVYLNVAGVLTLSVHLDALFGVAIAIGDYDNDGWNDIILAGATASLLGTPSTVLYHNVLGVFAVVNVGLLNVHSGALSFGDFDNDGWLDIAICGSTGLLAATHLYRNNLGVFVLASVSIPGLLECVLGWGDFNCDGLLDLAVSGSLGLLGSLTTVFVNVDLTNGLFVSADLSVNLLVNAQICIADVNLDFLPDLLVQSSSTLDLGISLSLHVGLYLNLGGHTCASVCAPPASGVTYSWVSDSVLKVAWDVGVFVNTYNFGLKLGLDLDLTVGAAVDWVVPPHSRVGVGCIGQRLIHTFGNCGPRRFAYIYGLDSTKVYLFGLQAIGANLAASEFLWLNIGGDVGDCALCGVTPQCCGSSTSPSPLPSPTPVPTCA